MRKRADETLCLPLSQHQSRRSYHQHSMPHLQQRPQHLYQQEASCSCLLQSKRRQSTHGPVSIRAMYARAAYSKTPVGRQQALPMPSGCLMSFHLQCQGSQCSPAIHSPGCYQTILTIILVYYNQYHDDENACQPELGACGASRSSPGPECCRGINSMCCQNVGNHMGF